MSRASVGRVSAPIIGRMIPSRLMIVAPMFRVAHISPPPTPICVVTSNVPFIPLEKTTRTIGGHESASIIVGSAAGRYLVGDTPDCGTEYGWTCTCSLAALPTTVRVGTAESQFERLPPFVHRNRTLAVHDVLDMHQPGENVSGLASEIAWLRREDPDSFRQLSQLLSEARE